MSKAPKPGNWKLTAERNYVYFTRLANEHQVEHPEPVIRCAWCWMFGRQIEGGWDHMERPLTKHPFVPYMEVVGV